MIRLLLTSIALWMALPAFGQTTDVYRVYFYRRLSAGANEVITVQQPAITLARETTFEGALITAPSACTATLEVGGTAATATAGVFAKLNTKADAAHALVFVGSDAGVGTVIHNYSIPAGQTYPILKGGLVLAPATAGRYTLRTNCASGTEFTLIHSEK